MSILYDANVIFDAGSKAMAGSKFKQATQLYEMEQLLNTARIQRAIIEGSYKPSGGTKFLIKERGKARFITSNTMIDKTVNHVLCDKLITPAISKYIIYDNSSSQKNKGVEFHRRRLADHLRRYYMRHGTNEGFILLSDFSGYYPNIRHEPCVDILERFLRREFNAKEVDVAMPIIRDIFRSFEMDVSRFTDEEVAGFYAGKVDAMLNCGTDRELLTGTKILKKGVDIGNQISQDIGIVYPYRVDNYVKIVCGIEGYGRYTDDTYAISDSREELLEMFEGVRRIAAEHGLIINERKTRICRLKDWFRVLQINYRLTETGGVPMKIHPKTMTRERHKLKAYKRLLDRGIREYADIENDFKSWLGSNYRRMSRRQIENIINLYFTLFRRKPQWKKGHGRLNWLTAQSLEAQK